MAWQQPMLATEKAMQMQPGRKVKMQGTSSSAGRAQRESRHQDWLVDLQQVLGFTHRTLVLEKMQMVLSSSSSPGILHIMPSPS
mmetsp:Transcript_2391/g.4372  ORF Transcript_2391/g.4372 Transcript_2391/m.4372 type:complete len:84 (-) Transcript_2391:187-438(-)